MLGVVFLCPGTEPGSAGQNCPAGQLTCPTAGAMAECRPYPG